MRLSPLKAGWLCAPLLCLAAQQAAAHWIERRDLPDWAQPGRVRWCLCYGTLAPKTLELVAEARQNLYQDGYLEESPCADLAQTMGIRGMTYIPLTWDYAGGRIFDRFSELRAAEAVKADGSRLFLYHDGRYVGCYNQPAFRARRMAELDAVAKSATIFFDTTDLVSCHCALCRSKFREFCLKDCGKDYPFPAYDGVRRETPEDRAFFRFRIECVADYFDALRRHLDNNRPPNLVCPNLQFAKPWHIELISRGVPDLVFNEEHRHPPFKRNFMGYKIAQAASHGKVAGQLLYLPAAIRSERGHSFTSRASAGKAEQDFQAPLLPQEIMLAVAEAQACNGVYIPGYCIDPAAPMLDRADPVVAADLEALRKFYAFVAKHEALYAGARPASDVAVLYPIRSQLWRSTPTMESLEIVGDLLTAAGIPFEVLSDDDLDPKLLKGVRVLILPGATCLARGRGAAVRSFIEAGGAAVISQGLGMCDENGDPSPAPPVPQLQTLNAVTELPLGNGRILFSPDPFSAMPPAKASGLIRGACRDVRCRIENPSPALFANLLEGKRVTEVHLVNYGFLYAPLNLEAADDDGSGELRTPFVKTTGCAKKTLTIPDPTRFKKPLIRINGVSASDQGYELVVALNGKEAGRLPAAQLKTPGWHEVPVERTALKAGANTIIIHAEGSPNAHPDYFSLAIDRDSAAGRSSWSEEGRRYSNEDLSGFDPGPQTGEYMIRITEWRDPAQPWPSEKLLESVKVAPAKDVAVSLKVLAGKELYCAVVSPEHGPAALEYERIGDRIKVVVPRVDIYGILLVSTQRRALDALCQGQP